MSKAKWKSGRCPKCKAVFKVPDFLTTTTCKHCQNAFEIPKVENTQPSQSPYGADINEKITFKCHKCSHSITTPRKLAGRQGKCPKCQTVLTIPNPKGIPSRDRNVCKPIGGIPQTREPKLAFVDEIPGQISAKNQQETTRQIIVPTYRDFIFALHESGADFSVNFKTLRGKNIVKQYNLVNEKPLATCTISRFLSTDILLFTDKGIHFQKEKELCFLAYVNIKSASDSLVVDLADGNSIQIPQLPHSSANLVALLRALCEPELYSSLRLDVDSAVISYEKSKPPETFAESIGYGCGKIIGSIISFILAIFLAATIRSCMM